MSPEDGSTLAMRANAYKRPSSLKGEVLSQDRWKGLCVFEIRKKPPPNSAKNELTFLLRLVDSSKLHSFCEIQIIKKQKTPGLKMR